MTVCLLSLLSRCCWWETSRTLLSSPTNRELSGDCPLMALQIRGCPHSSSFQSYFTWLSARGTSRVGVSVRVPASHSLGTEGRTVFILLPVQCKTGMPIHFLPSDLGGTLHLGERGRMYLLSLFSCHQACICQLQHSKHPLLIALSQDSKSKYLIYGLMKHYVGQLPSN